MFNSLETSEGTMFLLDGSSCEIKGNEMVSMKLHDGTVKKLDEIRYILSFKKNLILLSGLNSTGFRWKAGGRILKVMHDSRVVIRGRKYGGHYLMMRSLVQGGAPGGGTSNTR